MAGSHDTIRADDPPAAVAAGTTKNENSAIRSIFRRPRRRSPSRPVPSSNTSMMDEKEVPPNEKWSMGILNDRWTEEVPGTVLLLSANRNEPLGLQHQAARDSSSSLPQVPPETRRGSMHSAAAETKKTPDGQILLDPQPDDSMNDPLNWPAWRRDSALLTVGFYCMLGGGMTPILAAGFNDVAKSFDVSYQRVALTTGLYMMGLGVGSVIFSPTAILFGKRPVYLVSAVMFVLTSVWCAKAPNYANLVTARVFQGISVSPVECLPSATIAEIFFLHERAFRVGIYTLLLLGGKNLMPLVSAAIIQAKEWRWVFWVVAIAASFGLVVLFLFVPETFWDRTPRPRSRRPAMPRRSISNLLHHPLHRTKSDARSEDAEFPGAEKVMTPRQARLHDMNAHARFMEPGEPGLDGVRDRRPKFMTSLPIQPASTPLQPADAAATGPEVPHLHNLNSPYYVDLERNDDYVSHHSDQNDASPQERISSSDPAAMSERRPTMVPTPTPERLPSSQRELSLARYPTEPDHTIPGPGGNTDDGFNTVPLKEENEKDEGPLHKFSSTSSTGPDRPYVVRYTTALRQAPPKSYVQTLKPWNGRLTRTSWWLVALRPFILYAYPSVLWSTLVYSLSVGWLIVLSESVSDIYRNKASYNFSALGTGLVYLSPFIGGVLGTAVAGKVSDIVVRYLSRRNGGVYEPEFRLIMAAPVMLTTTMGLMGFGWSAQERDRWIIPTVFFGIISFGCSLGSTTAITFCVDSYRQYAGEALVTLNFSKNIFHGLVFSLFFAQWLESDGPKNVFLAIGGIQVVCLLTTIPMYIYGKRCRMWTVRKKFMEKF